MSTFSIETAAEQIVDPRTRGYFREVYSSYTNGNYRSAVVMLWSVVVCDLLFKLEDLKSKLDPAADTILKEIDARQQTNPTSPDWEALLVEKVKERTHLLDGAELLNLTTLRQHRHLSAHPVLTGAHELFTPNRETARAHIRNALEAVLTKPALLSRKIVDVLLEDLERLSASMPYNSEKDEGDDDLRRYLEATYFRHLSQPVTEQLFKSLWRLVFKVTDPRAEANRQINYRCLRLLHLRNPATIDARIKNEAAYFSEIAVNGAPVKALASFIFRRPQIYAALTDAAKVPIDRLIASNPMEEAMAWFVTGDLKKHLEGVLANITAHKVHLTRDPYAALCDLADDRGLGELVSDIGIEEYLTSSSFDEADARFRNTVKTRLEKLTERQFKTLLAGIERNDQTYMRSRCAADHKLIRAAAEKVLGATFDYSPYSNFMKSIS